MLIQENLSIEEKLRILSDAAKYDAACTSSGVGRKGKEGFLGNSRVDGICHSFASDGRCISLLKILFTNQCIYDCHYCVNRRSNDTVRTSFYAGGGLPSDDGILPAQLYRGIVFKFRCAGDTGSHDGTAVSDLVPPSARPSI